MSREGVLRMREVDRAVVIGQVAERRLRQREAAERLGLSGRQVRRLLARYRERGPSGLVSEHRGKRSNNAMAEATRIGAMELVRERYPDFGPDAAELDLIFCEQHRRKLTKNLTIRFECREYQVTGRGKGYRLRGAEVTVCKSFHGAVTVLREGRELPVRLLAEGEEAVPVEDGKTVRGRVGEAKAEQRARPAYKPPPDHPWRRPFKPAAASVATG